jgi:hypothetical protein
MTVWVSIDGWGRVRRGVGCSGATEHVCASTETSPRAMLSEVLLSQSCRFCLFSPLYLPFLGENWGEKEGGGTSNQYKMQVMEPILGAARRESGGRGEGENLGGVQDAGNDAVSWGSSARIGKRGGKGGGGGPTED